MPTYDYQCVKCRATYETREGFDAPTSHKCQECGKGTAKRLLTVPRIVFKGSGFYVTDSKSKTSAIADSDSGSTASGDSATKTDTKSETKASSGESTAPKSDAPAAKSEAKPAKSAPAAAAASSD